jgi:hypothetical protein
MAEVYIRKEPTYEVTLVLNHQELIALQLMVQNPMITEEPKVHEEVRRKIFETINKAK